MSTPISQPLHTNESVDGQALLARLWHRHHAQLIIPLFIACVYTLPVAASIIRFFMSTGQPIFSYGLVGYYTIYSFLLVSALVVSFTLVRPTEMGLFVGGEARPGLKGSAAKVAAITIGIMAMANAIRIWLQVITDSPAREVPIPYGPVHELFPLLAAGPHEEVIAATLIILCLRAGWHPVAAVATVSVLRGLWHIYHGVPALIWACLWSAAFACLFLRYRRVMPIIVVHMGVNLLFWIFAMLAEGGPSTG